MHGSRTHYGYNQTTIEAKWQHEFLMDLAVVENLVPDILIDCDN
jgi:hypothetical protein